MIRVIYGDIDDNIWELYGDYVDFCPDIPHIFPISSLSRTNDRAPRFVVCIIIQVIWIDILTQIWFLFSLNPSEKSCTRGGIIAASSCNYASDDC